MSDTVATSSSKGAHRTNSVIDAEMRKTCLLEAVEHGAKPWALEAEDALVRDVVGATVAAVEEKMSTRLLNVRPLVRVQALVQAAWLTGFHAGRHYETALAKAKREAAKVARKAADDNTRVRRTTRAQQSDKAK